MEANQRESLRRKRMMKLSNDAFTADQTRVRENPEARDIENGDALNAILDQLTNPKVHSTALRMIKDPVDSKTLREIPFVNASEAVTISLDELTGEGDWPLALRGEAFANARKAYTEVIDKAVKEDEEGTLSAETLAQVENAGSALRAKLEEKRSSFSPVEYAEAANYIKALIAMSRMLQKPAVDKILTELDKVKKTSLGSLLTFMHAYNLRFAPPKTAAQRAVYIDLYPHMDAARDRILKDLKDAGADTSAPLSRDDRYAIGHYSALKLEPLK